MSDTDSKKRKSEADDSGATGYKVVMGKHKSSEFGQFCLLVPEHQANDVCSALQNAKEKYFGWSVNQDDVIRDVSIIPNELGLTLRTIDSSNIPINKSEVDLLDWLIHGESYFATKFIVLTIEYHFQYHDDGFPKRLAFKATKPSDMDFLEIATQIKDKCVEYNLDRECYQIGNVQVIDRERYANEFLSGLVDKVTTARNAIDEALIQKYKDALNGDEQALVNWMADEFC